MLGNSDGNENAGLARRKEQKKETFFSLKLPHGSIFYFLVQGCPRIPSRNERISTESMETCQLLPIPISTRQSDPVHAVAFDQRLSLKFTPSYCSV